MNSWRRRPRLVWLLLASLWLGALAPTVAQAMASARGDIRPWSEICSQATDAATPARARAADPADAIAAMLLEHCPACLLQAQHHAAPLPVLLPALADPRLAHAVPQRYTSAAVTPHAWAAQHARGPPGHA